MIFTDERVLAANIKAGAPLPVYLLYGGDARRIESCRNALCAAVGESELLRIDGRLPFSVDEAADFALSMSFFGGRRGVLIDDLDAAALRADDFEKLCELLSAPEPGTLLILTSRTGGFDPNDKKDRRAGKLRTLCDKAGGVCEFRRLSAADAARLATSLAAAQKCVLEREEAVFLADCCGADPVRIQSEVDKLVAHSAEGRITRADIEALVTPTVEANVFRLSELLLRGETEGALRLIDDLIFLREEPAMLLSLLSMAFSDIYKAKAAQRARISLPEAAKAYGLNAYRFEKADSYARRLADARLLSALALLGEAELAVKSAGAEARGVLETTAVQIAGGPR